MLQRIKFTFNQPRQKGKTHEDVLHLCCCDSAVAQKGTTGVSFAVGPRLGFNLASASYDPSLPSQISNSMRFGFAFGGAAELTFMQYIAVQVEPMYIMKGNRIEGPIFTDGVQVIQGKISNNLALLEFPILFKGKYPAGIVTPYAFVGPSFGIVLTSKSQSEPVGYQSFESDEKDNTSSLDFGLAFGGGAEVKVTPMIGVIGDFRYVLGLTDMAKEPAAQPAQQSPQDQKVKTSGIQFLFGMLIHI